VSKIKLSKTRYFIIAAGIFIIAAAGAGKFALGTYCSVCPIGFLQITAASRSIPVDMLAGVAVSVVAVLIFGKFFCGWLCSTTLLKHMFGTQQNKPLPTGSKYASFMEKLPFIILIMAVGVSFIVRFPVFCIICPIGIFFGFIFAIFRTFYALDPSWNLIIFPTMLIIELALFRKWCAYICPISALFRLISRVPFIKLRPVAKGFSCLTAKGGHCSHCRDVCPEGIEVVNDKQAIKEKCTSCLECMDNCATESISYEVLKPEKKLWHQLVSFITRH